MGKKEERQRVKRFEAFTDYVRHIADELRLRDWTVVCHYSSAVPQSLQSKRPDDHEWNAVAACVPRRKYVEFTFHVDLPWWDDLEELRQTVVHEVLHMHFAPLWDHVRLQSRTSFADESYDQYTSAFEAFLEYAVDGIADGIHKHLPLFDPAAYQRIP